MIIGKSHDSFSSPLLLCNEPIEFVKEWKYLGAFIIAGKNIALSPKNDLRNFYASFNSIYNSCTRLSEVVLMHLLFTNCVPNLTYAAEVKNLTASEMTKCNTALNDAIRKIFTFNRWESIRSLTAGLGYPDLYTIFDKRRSSFFSELEGSSNCVLKHLYSFTPAA